MASMKPMIACLKTDCSKRLMPPESQNGLQLKFENKTQICQQEKMQT